MLLSHANGAVGSLAAYLLCAEPRRRANRRLAFARRGCAPPALAALETEDGTRGSLARLPAAERSARERERGGGRAHRLHDPVVARAAAEDGRDALAHLV